MFVFTSNLKVEFPFLRDTNTKSEIIIIFFFFNIWPPYRTLLICSNINNTIVNKTI